jgi:nucleotide-binding universal stress UspA family protein
MRILIATKPSSHAEVAVHYGLTLAKQTRAELTFIHVIRRPDAREAGNEYLRQLGTNAKKSGVDAQQLLRVGNSGEQIIHLAYEGQFDLIVLGEGSKESLLRRLVAPTNEKVVANAPCPVLIVKGAAVKADGFLVLHSGQEGLNTINRFLIHAGKLIGKKSKVTLLHVMSQIGASYRVQDWELRAEAKELIKKRTLEGTWLKEGTEAIENARKVDVAPKVRHGLVIDEILKEVDQGDYDIVILGSHHRGGWSDFLVDNIAKQVISRVKRPVLVVHGETGPSWTQR